MIDSLLYIQTINHYKVCLTLRKSISLMVSQRTQCWALTVPMYEYTIKHRSGESNSNTDALNRLLLPDTPNVTPVPSEVILMLEQIDSSLLTASQVRMWTHRDPLLSQVYHFVQNGWPLTKLSSDFQPFLTKRDELSIVDNCLLWGSRLVIPHAGRKFLLDELHKAHPGISRMKSRARTLMWWPNIDKDIENKVKSCSLCQVSRPLPPSVLLQPWLWPDKPWLRHHVDYAGPMKNKMYLVTTEKYSKWMDVFPVMSANTEKIIEKLRTLFASHGIPNSVVTDNATDFVSEEMKKFWKNNGIQHVISSLYHPGS